MSGGDFIGNLIIIGNGAGMGGGMFPHEIGGALHLVDSKADLESKISGAPVLISTVAGEIAALPVKAAPVGADLLMIEDSADTNKKKQVLISSLPPGGGLVSGFYCTQVGANQSIPNNSETLVTYDTKTDDPLNEFDLANDRFVAAAAGRYTFSACAYCQITATGSFTLRLKRNANIIYWVNFEATGARTTLLNLSGVTTLAAGDVVTLTAIQISGAAGTLFAAGRAFGGGRFQ